MSGPVAKFSFNNKNSCDEISGAPVKLIGINFTQDRFNNEDNAVYLFGSESSYINLGRYKTLKQPTATIVMWVKLENVIWSGQGHNINPFIITKRNSTDDFYESYIMGYYPETKKVVTWCSRDSLKQVGMTSIREFELFKWHQVAIAYDDNWLCFYIDGKQEATLAKNFETKFMDSDSVIVGITANKKNNRFLNASVDDISFYNRMLGPEEIQALYNAPNPNRFNLILNGLLYVMGFLAIITGLYFYIKYRLGMAMKKEKQKLELQNLVLETELRVNRALMNPHFVFNSLNALQNFILNQEYRQANHYLVKFSKLMRRVLESNLSNSTNLEMEIELISRYLEIENLRFEKGIKYEINIGAGIIPTVQYIPIMMIQPFIENAIWHGLLKKAGEKLLSISFFLVDNIYIQCVITDNGVGRIQQISPNPKNGSLATLFIKQRLDLLNKIYHLNCSLVIEDNPKATGTVVKILLPILNK